MCPCCGQDMDCVEVMENPTSGEVTIEMHCYWCGYHSAEDLS